MRGREREREHFSELVFRKALTHRKHGSSVSTPLRPSLLGKKDTLPIQRDNYSSHHFSKTCLRCISFSKQQFIPGNWLAQLDGPLRKETIIW